MTTLSLGIILSSAQTSHSCMLRFTLQQYIYYPVEKHNWMVLADPDILPEGSQSKEVKGGPLNISKKDRQLNPQQQKRKTNTSTEVSDCCTLHFYSVKNTDTILATLHKMIYRTFFFNKNSFSKCGKRKASSKQSFPTMSRVSETLLYGIQHLRKKGRPQNTYRTFQGFLKQALKGQHGEK